mgnify:CR=1 FL=1
MQEKLKKLLENSYSPYSNFPVAAIVVMKDGKEFQGVNVESANYASSICSERSAILSAISNGYKKGDFKEVHVMISSGEIGYPCFVCRQMISELFSRDAIVKCYSTKGEVEIHTVEELCPYPFSEDDLK